MSQQLTLELSDEVYAALQQQASAIGLSVAEWIVASLSRQYTPSVESSHTEAHKEAARLRFQSHAGAVHLGYATGADNESIDADLAKAYSNEY